MSTILSLATKLTMDASEYNRTAEEAKGTASRLGDSLSSMVSTGAHLALGAVAAGVGAITGAAIAGIKAVSDWGENVKTYMEQIGATAEQGSGLAVMMNKLGISTETMTKQLVFMGKGLVTDKGELGKTGVAIQKLGVNIKDTNGNLRSSTDIFADVATQIDKMPDGIEKTNLMMQIFGKSGKEMSDVLEAAANGGLSQYMDKAKQLGLSLDENATAASERFGRSLNELKMVGQGLLVTIGSELLPKLQPLLDKFMEWAEGVMPIVIDWLGKAIDWIFKTGEAIWTGLQPAITAIKNWWDESGIYLWEGIVSGIKDAWQWLVDLWNGPLTTAGAALKKWWDESGINLWAGVVDGFKGAWQLTVDLWNGPLATARKDLYDWIVGTAIPKTKEWGDTIKGWLVDNFGALITFMRGLANNELPAMGTKWDGTWEGMRKTIDTFTAGWPGWLKFIVDTALNGVQLSIDLFSGKWYAFGQDMRRQLGLTIGLLFGDVAGIASNLSSVAGQFVRTTFIYTVTQALKAIEELRNVYNVIAGLLGLPQWNMAVNWDLVGQLFDAIPNFNFDNNAPPGFDDTYGAPPGQAPVQVTFNYQPTMSLADQYEAEAVLTPFIMAAMRSELNGV